MVTVCVIEPTKVAMLILLALLLLCHGVGNVHCSTVHKNSVDLHALLHFKMGIKSDPKGVFNNWNTSTHFCRWHGVSCSTARPWRVTKLNITGQSLYGKISSSLNNLTFLQTLNLSNNNFDGPLPLLSNLQHLEELNLRFNFLDGIIPDALTNCSNLIHMDLSRNLLKGVIPPSIGNLSKLVGLSFFRNNLTGIIPTALGTITTLQVLSLGENQLSGRIPDELWQMPKIVKLHLYENGLSGGIPQTLSNISSLQYLSLSFNMLGHSLPSNIGYALPNLKYLYLSNNSFEGQIPASLGNASGLEQIDLSSNKFIGQVPSSLGMLLNLTLLNLEVNMIEARDSEGWEFLHALANCSVLGAVSLAHNQLQGAIPDSIGNLSISLTNLLMNENKLSGPVPPTIAKLRGLIQLSLNQNNITGTTEEWIGELINLQHINLQANNFIGTIPQSISNLSQLIFFSAAKNEFTGFVPPSLGNLQRMLKLNLSYNNLQGSIPVEFGNFKNLNNLDLSSNKFSGEIPETLGQCQQLVTIRMDQNLLTGNIPTSFSSLTNLMLLNLSHNHLSGTVPPFPYGVNLLKIDLSYNNFEGEIPRGGVYDNATDVSLDGNSRLCGGSIELHMPSCPSVARRVRGVNYWVKILVPIFGFLSLILLVYFLLLEKKTSRISHLELSLGEHFDKVTYKDLAQATRDFSELNLIGRGSYGSVYKGKLEETKMEVAVKVFNLEMRGAERSFMSECEALRSIKHRNLLPIKTACSPVDSAGNVFKALVYEFMPNGNLDTWLHKKGDDEAPKRLGLTQRISIAVNVADALDYLHHDCGRPTVHCDLKPSNILLDDDMNAVLGDFGIARFYADPQSTWAGSVSSIGVKGTIGYIPPEYGGGGHASTSGDVYSFGIVLLEILTGKRPTDPIFTNGLDIVKLVDNSFPDQIFHAVDAHLVEECKNVAEERMIPESATYQCLVSLLQVALSCTHLLPSERLNMKQVASKIHAIKKRSTKFMQSRNVPRNVPQNSCKQVASKWHLGWKDKGHTY